MIENNYLIQRERRLKRAEDQEQLLWGTTLGVLLMMIGSFNYFFVRTNNDLDFIWGLLIIIGCLLFIMAFIRPQLIAYIQKPLKQAGGWLGERAIRLILLTVYFLLIMPLGLMVQLIRGPKPFYYWNDKYQKICPSWEKKKIVEYSQTKMLILVYPFYIIYFMIENKAYIVIPLVCILLFIALFVFFTQTPVVAPFVYTLF